jgi:hypothetical protein
MPGSATRDGMLRKIQSNIERFGHHVYLIVGKQSPRFAYTIGVSPPKGAELVLAGAATYSDEEVKQILDAAASREAAHLVSGSSIEVDALGAFSLRKVDGSWAAVLIRGAIDYYRRADVPALQVVPDEEHWTIDVPDLSRARTVESEPVWRWLAEPWDHSVPDSATAATNLDALRGKPITEAARWEVDQWELFAGAGPDVPEDDMREVPLGTLLAADPSLAPILDLEVGKGLWRDAGDAEWHAWGK